MSSLTHCSHVFLLLPWPLAPSTTSPLQADTQSSTLLRSRCPNHLNLPRLTKSTTQLMPRRLHKSSLHLLSFKDTPHIHLTIMCSVLSKLLRHRQLISHHIEVMEAPLVFSTCKFPISWSQSLFRSSLVCPVLWSTVLRSTSASLPPNLFEIKKYPHHTKPQNTC